MRNKDARWRYTRDGAVQAIPMRRALAVDSGAFLQTACLQGLGIMQVSIPTANRLIASGALVEVLPVHGAADTGLLASSVP